MAELSGFYEGMDFDGYAGIDALNGSRLLAMRRSPMYYKWALIIRRNAAREASGHLAWTRHQILLTRFPSQ